MRLYARSDTTIISAAQGVDVGDPAVLPFHARGATATLDIDEATNDALTTELAADTAAFRLVAGVLMKNAIPVIIAPPGRFITDKQQVEQNAQQLDTLLAKLDGGTDLTPAERQAAFRFLLRAVRFVLRWIVKRG